MLTLIMFLVIVGTCNSLSIVIAILELKGETKEEDPTEIMLRPCPLPMKI